ncbi:hypothetical protein [Breoghania sp. L-A4]|nr:hypothetical protein [Breoghania sp. L-A4]
MSPASDFRAGFFKGLPIILATAPFGLLLGRLPRRRACRCWKSR